MLHAGARHRLEQFGCELGRASHAARREIDFTGLRSGQGHELAYRAGRKRRVDREQQRSGSDETHRIEIPNRIVRKVFLQIRIDRMRRHARQKQRVAIRRGFGGEFGAERSARAGPVVDDKLLAQCKRQFLRDHAREHVVAAAGSESDNEPYLFRRIILGGRGCKAGIAAKTSTICLTKRRPPSASPQQEIDDGISE